MDVLYNIRQLHGQLLAAGAKRPPVTPATPATPHSNSNSPGLLQTPSLERFNMQALEPHQRAQGILEPPHYHFIPYHTLPCPPTCQFDTLWLISKGHIAPPHRPCSHPHLIPPPHVLRPSVVPLVLSFAHVTLAGPHMGCHGPGMSS